jgi:putative acetyltransferase
MSVLPSHQGDRVGSAIIGAGLGEMRQQIPSYCPRFGFTPAGEVGFRKPSLRIPDEAFQALRMPSYEPR